MLPTEELSMNSKDWKKEIFTIPNILSLFRLALIPAYITVYLRARTPAQHYLSGGILAVSCLTDGLDGYLARKYGWITTVGKILDPLADKVTQFAVILCLSQKYPALVPVLLLLVTKETTQLAAGLLFLRKGLMLTGALPAGKVCTTVLFISMILMVLFPNLPTTGIHLLAIVNIVFLSVSFLCYLMVYLGKRPGLDTAFQK